MLVGALVVLLAVIAVLAIPVTVAFRVAWPQVGHNDVRLRWAFGLVRARIPSERSPAPQSEPAEETPSRRKRPSRKTPNVLAAIREPRFRRRLMRFLSDCWKAIHKHDLRLRVRIGLDDPADTGQLWAFCGPVAGLLQTARHASIRLEPDFAESTFELDGSGRVRIVPLRLLHLAGALLLSPAVWSGLRQMRAP